MIKTFAVIGDPIDHSMSPNIHNAVFKELNMDATYIAYRIPKGELEEGIQSLKKIQISGFNVTIPHKVEIMKFLDKTDEYCSIIGAANTVTNDNGVLKGYNTDMDGFLDPIKKREKQINNKSVLLLGAGGAARAIVAGFAKEHAKKITIANRTLEKAKDLVRFSKRIGLEGESTTIEEIPHLAKYDFIVNSTSIGLKNEKTPLKTDQITKDIVVYDIVYMPMNTDLIKKSKDRGAEVIFGYEMLLGQAVRAFEIWHGKEAPYSTMKRALVGAV